METTTIGVESATLTDEQQSHVHPISFMELTDAQWDIVSTASETPRR